MKNRMALTLTVLALTTFAQTVWASGSGDLGMLEGDWEYRGNRLSQKDPDAPRAKAWVRYPQNGITLYEFSVRFDDGLQDGHGGFGIHILADSVPDGPSWGAGKSWLLWLNYDEAPEVPGIPPGLSLQLYESTGDILMRIVESVSLDAFMAAVPSLQNTEIPICLEFRPENGRLIITDPANQGPGWYLDLPGAAGAAGSYIVLRSNGAAVSFAPTKPPL